MRIVFILTGQMERKAFTQSLVTLFPRVEFEIEPPLGTPAELLPTSFTSNQVPFTAQSPAEQKLDALVQTLAAAVEPGRKGKGRPALVVLLEDLELANLSQPEAVQAELRQAIARHIERLRADRRGLLDPQGVALALQERASFHLMCPMTEAYFFGDPQALAHATPRAALAKLAPGVDLEQFQVADPDYLAPIPEGAHCPQAKNGKVPWAGEERGRHPKNYVQYLSRQAPQQPYCTDYRETKQGAAALAALRWSAVLLKQAVPFARALVEDIAHALGVPNPVAPPGDALTSILQKPRPTILRNL